MKIGTGKIVLLFLLFSYVLRFQKQKCRILALEGGGTKGAFHAGAAKAMIELIKAEELQYDVISGASVGAINGLLFAIQEKGKEQDAATSIMNFWTRIQRTDVYQHWPFLGPIQGLFTKPSFVDNSPIYNLISKGYNNSGGTLHRKFTIGIVDAQSGEYLVVDETVKPQTVPFYLAASASVPGIFKYVRKDKRVMIDGGSLDNLNLPAAIQKCYSKVGGDESLITLDLIMTNPYPLDKMDMSSANPFYIYQRKKDLASETQAFWYIGDAVRAHPKIEWRYLIIPKETLPNFPIVPLSFDEDNLKRTIQIGYEDAKRIIQEKRTNFQTIDNLSPFLRRKKIV